MIKKGDKIRILKDIPFGTPNYTSDFIAKKDDIAIVQHTFEESPKPYPQPNGFAFKRLIDDHPLRVWCAKLSDENIIWEKINV